MVLDGTWFAIVSSLPAQKSFSAIAAFAIFCTTVPFGLLPYRNTTNNLSFALLSSHDFEIFVVLGENLEVLLKLPPIDLAVQPVTL